MGSDPKPWTLIIPSDLRLLALARSFVESACQVAGMDERMTHTVVLATDEAANNVMRHAHRDLPLAFLQIHCFVRPNAVEIQLHDEGRPFDLEAVPEMDPSELRVGGRGVFLMRKLMDELAVEPRETGGNTLRMVKRITPPADTEGASRIPG